MEMIKTSLPVMDDRSEITRDIAKLWNKISVGFCHVWGPHIHHGYFETCEETPISAQETLINKLVGLIGVCAQDKILDVGCGIGGSSFYLAKHYGAIVTGISLSQKQIEIAQRYAQTNAVKHTHFTVEDALSMASIPSNSFDTVWALESCEQFYDKRLFIEQAFRVLKPGGKLMLATWCSSAEEFQGVSARKYTKLCTVFQLPYMPTLQHYDQLLQQQGFVVNEVLEWSSKVAQSWRIGLSGIKLRSIVNIFLLSGWQGLLFLKNCRLMKEGFDEKRIEYGVFSAVKP